MPQALDAAALQHEAAFDTALATLPPVRQSQAEPAFSAEINLHPRAAIRAWAALITRLPAGSPALGLVEARIAGLELATRQIEAARATAAQSAADGAPAWSLAPLQAELAEAGANSARYEQLIQQATERVAASLGWLYRIPSGSGP